MSVFFFLKGGPFEVKATQGSEGRQRPGGGRVSLQEADAGAAGADQPDDTQHEGELYSILLF